MIRILVPIKIYNAVLTEEMAIDQLKDSVNKLIQNGALKGDPSDILSDYTIDLSNNTVILVISDKEYVDPSKLNSVGASLGIADYSMEPQVVDQSKYEQAKSFSISSIQTRLKESLKSPKIQMRSMIRDYSKYYNSKKSQIEKDPTMLSNLRRLFINDLMSLFNLVLPEIASGKQLNSLLGITQISPKMNAITTKLSQAYKMALKTEKSQGAPTKSQFTTLSNYYQEFVNELGSIVFGDTSTKTKSRKVRIYSRNSEGRINIYSKPQEVEIEDSFEIEGSNMVECDWKEGAYKGIYDDYEFTDNNGRRLRFPSSTFGDTEFDAVVEVYKGVATIHKLVDTEV